MKDIALIWVGEAQESWPEYYSLMVQDNGRGLLAIQYLPAEPAVAYRVVRTNLSRYKVSFVLEPVDRSSDVLFAEGTAVPGTLELQIGSKRPQWKRSVRLRPYDELMRRIDAVTRRAQEFAKTDK
jgi:hypothetical protein